MTSPLPTTLLPLLSLVGRVIVVTGNLSEQLDMNKKLMEIGGARGIGLTLSKACLEAGAMVVVIDILQEPDDGFTRAQNQTPDHLFYYPYALVNRR